MKSVYLDYAATAPLLPSVRAKMDAVMAGLSDGTLGNPSALHTPGQRAAARLADARQAVADLIGAEPSEIIFTSGGSEANNTVARIFTGQCIATSAIEHPAALEAFRACTDQLTILPVDRYGFVDYAALPAGTDLLSVMLANNELGTIEDPTSVSAVKFIHTDATQAVGKIPVDVKALGVDYLTFSAHKLGGPVGIGALYVRSGAPFAPFIRGGHQEQGRRAGTSNVLLAAGFAEAARAARQNLPHYAAVAKLRNELKRRILKEVPYSSCNSPDRNCLPNILNVSFQAAEGESIQLMLDAAGIVVSTGSACASGSLDPSHVLMATRGDAEVAHSSIRFSLGLDTTAADIDRVMRVLPDIVRKLQGMSTVKIKEEHD